MYPLASQVPVLSPMGDAKFRAIRSASIELDQKNNSYDWELTIDGVGIHGKCGRRSSWRHRMRMLSRKNQIRINRTRQVAPGGGRH